MQASDTEEGGKKYNIFAIQISTEKRITHHKLAKRELADQMTPYKPNYISSAVSIKKKKKKVLVLLA